MFSQQQFYVKSIIQYRLVVLLKVRAVQLFAILSCSVVCEVGLLTC